MKKQICILMLFAVLLLSGCGSKDKMEGVRLHHG